MCDQDEENENCTPPNITEAAKVTRLNLLSAKSRNGLQGVFGQCPPGILHRAGKEIQVLHVMVSVFNAEINYQHSS